jgi:hypothetical protein
MLWAATQRAGVRHLVTEVQDGFELAGVRFVNPFDAANNRLIDEILSGPALAAGAKSPFTRQQWERFSARSLLRSSRPNWD